MNANGIGFGLSACAGCWLAMIAAMASPALAQDGWPYSAWEEEKRPSKSDPGPARSSQDALPPMDAAPGFNDPRAGTAPGSYGNGANYGATDSYGGGSSSFATPPAVERVDLQPLEPAAPPAGGQDRPDGTEGRGDGRGFGAEPAREGFGRTEREVAPPPSGGTADLYSKPGRNGSAWSTATVAEQGRIDPRDEARLFKSLSGAPKSRTLRDLLGPVMAGGASGDGRDAEAAAAAKIDAQLRLGFVEQAAAFPVPQGLNRESSDWAGFALRKAVANAALDRGEDACRDARDIVAVADGLPAKDKDLAIALSGYCGALANTSAAVTLAADVARDRSGFDPAGLAGLEALARGSRPRIPASLQLSPLAYRMLHKAGADPSELVAAVPDAALLAAMPHDATLSAEARIEAAEKSAAAFIAPADLLAKSYGAAPPGADIEAMPSGREADTGNRVLQRANLFTSATRQPTPLRKVRLVRSYLDQSAKVGLSIAALEIMSETVAQIRPVHEIGWFAETAIEALLIGGRIDAARQWLRLAEDADPRGPGALTHWAALVDIADPSRSARRGDSLASLERMALRGDFRPADLHRLATVLDALDYQVPIPLWEAASRTPQPTDGHLPPTGVLSELQQAAKSGEHAKTVLLVASAIGPDGPAGAHMIALGDAIRALKRIGMDREARRLGVEALFLSWPRSAQG
ncbi:MAG: hypothetical protein KJ622_06575 [Alphaproteobacteria bacterium]|nr:hypothetical protein [Alphaproteobacteria bacterium]